MRAVYLSRLPGLNPLAVYGGAISVGNTSNHDPLQLDAVVIYPRRSLHCRHCAGTRLRCFGLQAAAGSDSDQSGHLTATLIKLVANNNPSRAAGCLFTAMALGSIGGCWASYGDRVVQEPRTEPAVH